MSGRFPLGRSSVPRPPAEGEKSLFCWKLLNCQTLDFDAQYNMGL